MNGGQGAPSGQARASVFACHRSLRLKVCPSEWRKRFPFAGRVRTAASLERSLT